MIQNGSGKIKKYDANEVYINNISIVDYINNKLDKVFNSITQNTPYSIGGTGYDGTVNLTTEYQPIDTGKWWGSTEAFNVQQYYVEYIGSTPRNNDNTYAKMQFIINIRFSDLEVGDKVWGSIKIKGKDGSIKNETFVSTTIANTSGDALLTTMINYVLVKGDRVSFELAMDKDVAVTILKPHWEIYYQQNIDEQYYKFRY